MKDEFKFVTEYLNNYSEESIDRENEVDWDIIDQTVPQFHSPVMSMSMDEEFRTTTNINLEELFFDSDRSVKEFAFVPNITDQDNSTKDYTDLDQMFYETPQDVKPVIGSSGEVIELGHNQLLEDHNITKKLITDVKEDINKEAVYLNISMDPHLWNLTDVAKWINWVCEKFGRSKPTMTYFQMDGASLCMLSENDFIWKCSEAGSTLYNQLVIWISACRIDLSEYLPKPAFNENSSTVMNSYHPLPSVSPSPSVDSSSGHSNSSDDAYLYPSPQTVAPIKKLPTPHRINMHHHKQTIHLWQFLKELLRQSDKYDHCIKWINRSKGIFKIEDSTRVAKEWGSRKNRPAMNYDKLSRSIRQYYKKGIIKKTVQSKRLVYQFCDAYL